MGIALWITYLERTVLASLLTVAGASISPPGGFSMELEGIVKSPPAFADGDFTVGSDQSGDGRWYRSLTVSR